MLVVLPQINVKLKCYGEEHGCGNLIFSLPIQLYSCDSTVVLTPRRRIPLYPRVSPFANTDTSVGDGGLRHDGRRWGDREVNTRNVRVGRWTGGGGYLWVGIWRGPSLAYSNFHIGKQRSCRHTRRYGGLYIPGFELRLSQQYQVLICISLGFDERIDGLFKPNYDPVFRVQWGGRDIEAGTEYFSFSGLTSAGSTFVHVWSSIEP